MDAKNSCLRYEECIDQCLSREKNKGEGYVVFLIEERNLTNTQVGRATRRKYNDRQVGMMDFTRVGVAHTQEVLINWKVLND